MIPVRLEPAAPQTRVKHSTTEPLRSHQLQRLPCSKFIDMILSKKVNNKVCDDAQAGLRLLLFAKPKDSFSSIKANMIRKELETVCRFSRVEAYIIH